MCYIHLKKKREVKQQQKLHLMVKQLDGICAGQKKSDCML